MGNNQSAPAPPPSPAPPVPVVSLPVQRVPTYDGASGLHYSGRVYTNQFQGLSSDICNGGTATAAQINDVMPNSVSTTSLPMDDSTQRISQSALQSYVEGLIASGVVPGQNADFDAQMKADAKFYADVQAEYCFYEARYVAALTTFLQYVSAPGQSTDSKTVDAALTSTVNLNKRLNSLLEIMNYVSNSRAQKVNSRSPSIDAANKTLQTKIGILKSQQEYLTSSDVRIRTQEEMLRYSAEKSRAMNIQIMSFVALNVVALGVIFTVYKGIGRPSA